MIFAELWRRLWLGSRFHRSIGEFVFLIFMEAIFALPFAYFNIISDGGITGFAFADEYRQEYTSE